jgi:large repetitive protein
MVVRRDLLPESLNSNHYFPYSYNSWPTGYQWAAGYDWTVRYYSSTGEYVYGRVLAMGMGTPLEPGTYYVGVTNSNSSDAMSYSLRSRGIGTDQDTDGVAWPIQVAELPFIGAASPAALPPREAAYFKVEILQDTTSWSLGLEPTLGDNAVDLRMKTRHAFS